MMTRKVDYKKALLRAIDAFLEESPTAHKRAHRIVRRCYNSLQSERSQFTLDDIVWAPFFLCLTDLVFYESKDFLQNTRATILGQHRPDTAETVISRYNYQIHFTPEESEWYAQLWGMLDFLMNIPFAHLYEATSEVRKKKENWANMLSYIPEVAQAEQLENEYYRQKESIKVAAERSPTAEYIGDEKIYHFILMEVSSILTNVNVGSSAIYFGFPAFSGSYIDNRSEEFAHPEAVDATQKITWARTLLEALRGEKQLFLSWRLGKGATAHSDVLLLSLS